MKRFFILASAAIVALASCAKTEVVYKDAPEQIAFKKVSNVMTKATMQGHSLGVFANINGTGGEYFPNTKFQWDAQKQWYESSRTWPLSGKLDFTVYFPYEFGAEYDAETNILTVPVYPSLIELDQYYYGSQRYIGLDRGDNEKNVSLNHMCAKITLKFANTSDYEFVSATLNDVYTQGNVNVNYGESPIVVTADVDSQHKCNLPIENLEEEHGYVLPGEQTSITVTFNQVVNQNTKLEVTRTVNLSDNQNPVYWEAHKHYTYALSVAANTDRIVFTATSNDWVSAGDDIPEELPVAELQ